MPYKCYMQAKRGGEERIAANSVQVAHEERWGQLESNYLGEAKPAI